MPDSFYVLVKREGEKRKKKRRGKEEMKRKW